MNFIKKSILLSFTALIAISYVEYKGIDCLNIIKDLKEEVQLDKLKESLSDYENAKELCIEAGNTIIEKYEIIVEKCKLIKDSYSKTESIETFDALNEIYREKNSTEIRLIQHYADSISLDIEYIDNIAKELSKIDIVANEKDVKDVTTQIDRLLRLFKHLGFNDEVLNEEYYASTSLELKNIKDDFKILPTKLAKLRDTLTERKNQIIYTSMQSIISSKSIS